VIAEVARLLAATPFVAIAAEDMEPAAYAALPMVPPVTDIPYTLPLLLVVYPLNVSAEIVAFVMVGLFRVGLVSVLPLSVCVPVVLTTVLGNVGVPPIVYVPDSVPLKVAPLIVGLVRVFAERVCVSVVPTGLPVMPRKVLRLICCVVLILLVTIGNVSPTASMVLATGNADISI
jgi:hypothetical protein